MDEANALYARDRRVIKLILDAGADLYGIDRSLHALELARTLYLSHEVGQIERMIQDLVDADANKLSIGGHL
jgi:hypothetical protein